MKKEKIKIGMYITSAPVMKRSNTSPSWGEQCGMAGNIFNEIQLFCDKKFGKKRYKLLFTLDPDTEIRIFLVFRNSLDELRDIINHELTETELGVNIQWYTAVEWYQEFTKGENIYIFVNFYHEEYEEVAKQFGIEESSCCIFTDCASRKSEAYEKIFSVHKK